MILLACGFGFPLPEDVILFSLGYLSFRGDVELLPSIGVAFAGVIVGDATIFLIGRIFGERIVSIPVFRRILTERRVDTVRRAFHRNGSVYLFFARFTPGLRAVTFWTAGMLRVPFRSFLLYDGVAALLSVPALTYLAYAAGEAFHDEISDIRDVMGLIAVVAFLVLILVTIARRKRTLAQTPEPDSTTETIDQ